MSSRPPTSIGLGSAAVRTAALRRQASNQLRARTDAELAEHVPQVVLDRLLAEEEPIGNVAVPCPLGDETYDLEFLWREQVDQAWRLAAGDLATRSERRSRALRPRHGAEEREAVERRAQQLAGRLVLIDPNPALAVAETRASKLERVGVTLEKRERLVEVGGERIVGREQPGAARRDSLHRCLARSVGRGP